MLEPALATLEHFATLDLLPPFTSPALTLVLYEQSDLVVGIGRTSTDPDRFTISTDYMPDGDEDSATSTCYNDITPEALNHTVVQAVYEAIAWWVLKDIADNPRSISAEALMATRRALLPPPLHPDLP